MLKFPPLPDLTALSREQLIDCAHRLNASLTATLCLLATLEQKVTMLEKRVGQTGGVEK